MAAETLEVECLVIEVLTDFGLAHAEARDGQVYGLNRHTPGVVFSDLRVGQRTRCVVTTDFNRVLKAQLPARDNSTRTDQRLVARSLPEESPPGLAALARILTKAGKSRQ